MEPATRRLAILSSHFTAPFPSSPSLSRSSCASHDRLQDCVFCLIARNESPAFKVYEDEFCYCILDRNPVSDGHSLLIPKEHYPCFEETPPSIIAAMCSKVPFISNAIVKAAGADSFNVLVNNGAAAGQVVFHTHIHIIPRKSSDCLWTTESLPRRPLKFDSKAIRMADCVRRHLCKISEDEKLIS